MDQAHFFLDPGYRDLVADGTFRGRYVQFDARLSDQVAGLGCSVALLPLAFIPLVLFLFTRDDEYLMASGAIAMIVIPFSGVCLWFWSASLRKFLNRLRLAKEGELVTGTIASAKFVEESVGDAEDGFETMLLIEYRAETSNGIQVTGSKSHKREDISAADVPAPGTPVWILVLDEKTHLLL